jgi:hypothetical protein
MLLAVQDSFAGKTGRCPNCGNTLPIPFPETGESPDRPPLYRKDAPVGRRRGARARRDEYDAYDDFDEPDYDADGRPSRRRSEYDAWPEIRKPTLSPLATLICLGIGIALLGVLSLIPLFPMFSVQVPPNVPANLATVAGMIQLTEGKIILIVTAAVAFLCVVFLILFLTVPESLSNLFLTLGSCLASGWGLVATIWLLGFIWDIFTVNNSIKSFGPNAGGGPGIAPGFGLWVGLCAALGVVAVFSVLLALRRGSAWLYLAEGTGLLIGVLLVALNVQPWTTWIDQKEFQANPFLLQKHKLIIRYVPLLTNARPARRF